MSSVTPFGIVNTTPFGTITFPVTVASTVILQLEGTVQGPETGGEHSSFSPTTGVEVGITMFDEGDITPITWLWDGEGVDDEGDITPITWLWDVDAVAEEGEGVFTEGVRGEVDDGVTDVVIGDAAVSRGLPLGSVVVEVGLTVVVTGLTDESRRLLIGSVVVEDGDTGVVMGTTTVLSGIAPKANPAEKITIPDINKKKISFF